MIIDTHAHLYWDTFQENFDEYIQRAIDAGVTGIFNVGVDIESSQTALRQAQGILAERHHEVESRSLTVYSSIGIHPEEALHYVQGKRNIDEDIKKLEEIYHQNPEKVKLVGECGMDFLFREEELAKASPEKIKELQIKLFQAQIDLAKKLNLPLSVHCRDDRSQNPTSTECWDEVIEMTKDHFGIYHCYSGLAQTTKRVLEETKFLISFAGNLTYKKNEYLREAVKMIPLERIVVETDCPFLPPQAHRGQQNEPSFITETTCCIAEIKGLSINEAEQQILTNTNNLIK